MPASWLSGWTANPTLLLSLGAVAGGGLLGAAGCGIGARGEEASTCAQQAPSCAPLSVRLLTTAPTTLGFLFGLAACELHRSPSLPTAWQHVFPSPCRLWLRHQGPWLCAAGGCCAGPDGCVLRRLGGQPFCAICGWRGSRWRAKAAFSGPFGVFTLLGCPTLHPTPPARCNTVCMCAGCPLFAVGMGGLPALRTHADLVLPGCCASSRSGHPRAGPLPGGGDARHPRHQVLHRLRAHPLQVAGKHERRRAPVRSCGSRQQCQLSQLRWGNEGCLRAIPANAFRTTLGKRARPALARLHLPGLQPTRPNGKARIDAHALRHLAPVPYGRAGQGGRVLAAGAAPGRLRRLP